MNDQQIYQLMAKTPNIRAVQIADALDKDLSDVSEALRSLVTCGDVVAHTGEAPNRQPTRMYNLSDDFKRSKDGRALLTSVVGAMLAEPVPIPVPATPSPVPAAFPTPVFATQDEMAPVRTKAQVVIEHLTFHKSATDAEMRTVMGLPKTSTPRAYLQAHVKSGKIVRDAGGVWTLGDGTPLPPAGQSPSLRKYNKTKPGPVAQFKPTAKDPWPAPAPKAPEIKPQASPSTKEEAAPMSQPEPKPPAEACKHDTPYRYECEECQDAAHSPMTAGATQDEPNPFGDPAPALASGPTFTGTITRPSTEPVFRCGLWSDGVLELQRNGVQVAALTRGEGEYLAAFMGRMLGQVETVAP